VIPSYTPQLPPPTDWVAFEDLCWHPFRAIWDDPDAQKNGRAWQVQHGVDIVGRPECGSKITGVQCNGKDNYTGK